MFIFDITEMMMLDNCNQGTWLRWKQKQRSSNKKISTSVKQQF